jgi:ribosomal protein S18 acetylase RimI-like enzyme
MPAGLRLEPTTVDDVDRIGRIVADASEREAFAERVSDWARRVFAGEGGDLRWWLAYLDDALVGSCTLRVLPNLGYLQGASVLPSQRGRGLYRAMTWMRLEQLRRRGISHAVIWADERTSGPIAQKMGFRVVTSLDYHELEAPGLDT